MAHEELALRSATEIGAWSVAVAGAVLLALAVAAELVRRVRSGSPFVALADRLLPTPWRRVAAAVVTVSATALALSLPPHAGADDRHTRSWLVDGATTSTSTTTRIVAPTSSTTAAPSTATEPATTLPTTTSTTTGVEIPPPAVTSAPPVVPPRPAPVLDGDIAPTTPVAPSADPPRVANAAPAPVAVGSTYTVVTGDCLWSIAARILGGRATGSAIDRGWRAIYAANREAVGADPNLIHPGLVLTLPPLDPTP